MKEKKSFTESSIYPIIFMIILTIFFVGILATFYHTTKAKVDSHRRTNFQKALVALFDFPTDNPTASFDKYFIQKDKKDIRYYQAVKDSTLLGYAFEISGNGLWGTIKAIISVTPDFSRIVNIEILDQNETPGLGGRITEDWFKKQFQNKPLVFDKKFKKYKLVAEDAKPNDFEIVQITGATFSSKAVVNIIYEKVKETSLKLGFDYE